MLPQFDSEWILDLDTGDVVNVSDLHNWGYAASLRQWGALVDGFTVEDPSQSRFTIPDSRPGVAVNVGILIEMASADRVVELTVDDGELVRTDSPEATEFSVPQPQ